MLSFRENFLNILLWSRQVQGRRRVDLVFSAKRTRLVFAVVSVWSPYSAFGCARYAVRKSVCFINSHMAHPCTQIRMKAHVYVRLDSLQPHTRLSNTESPVLHSSCVGVLFACSPAPPRRKASPDGAGGTSSRVHTCNCTDAAVWLRKALIPFAFVTSALAFSGLRTRGRASQLSSSPTMPTKPRCVVAHASIRHGASTCRGRVVAAVPNVSWLASAYVHRGGVCVFCAASTPRCRARSHRPHRPRLCLQTSDGSHHWCTRRRSRT